MAVVTLELPDDLRELVTWEAAEAQRPVASYLADRLLQGAHAGTLLKARAHLAWKRRHGRLPEAFEALACTT